MAEEEGGLEVLFVDVPLDVVVVKCEGGGWRMSGSVRRRCEVYYIAIM